MALWQRLYAMVWLSFFSCAFVPAWMGRVPGAIVHGILGIAVLALAAANAGALGRAAVPDRLKRISKATLSLAVMQLVLGGALGAFQHFAVPGWVRSIVIGMHITAAFAMLAQAASVATSYDMWEDREFEKPAPAAPAAPAGGAK
jgi:hypothetical protein